MTYRDRLDAGKQLAAQLSDYANRDDVLVSACSARYFSSESWVFRVRRSWPGAQSLRAAFATQ
jgi:hypothetical protein